MSAYEFYLFVHVLAAVIWVGGGLVVQIYGSKFKAAGSPELMEHFGSVTEQVGNKVFMPASIVTLIFGILLVTETGWEFSDPFVVYGIGAVVFSAAVGIAYLGPESGKIGALMAEKGPQDPEVASRLARLINVSRFELVVLFGAVFMMTAKPFM